MDIKIVPDVKIMVIGDIMVDHYIYGNCSRISPEAPVPVVEVSTETSTLGGAGNVLKNLVTFGLRPSIIGVVGDDDNASIVLNELGSNGIVADGVLKDKDRCTIVKSRVMVSNHQMLRLDREKTQPISESIQNSILDHLEGCIKEFHAVLISDYNKGLLTPGLLSGIVSLCKQHDIITIADPKGTDYSIYQGVDIIKPNRKEAMEASGIKITDNESLAQACNKIKQITGCKSVIVTMSENGMAIYNDEGLCVIPTKALGVIDVTGAGDTVLASLGLGLASGNSLKQACDLANHAAAVVVSKVGSATATLDEVRSRF